MENQSAPTVTRQNRVTVRYVDEQGKRLNEDLSLFGAVGSPYHVNVPLFSRYWLTDANAPISGAIPAGKRLLITLTYTKLGQVKLVQDGAVTQTITLQARPEDPSRIQALQLPPLDAGQHYYTKSAHHYHVVLDPASFIPTEPEDDVVFEVLTPEVADARSQAAEEAAKAQAQALDEASQPKAEISAALAATDDTKAPSDEPTAAPEKLEAQPAAKAQPAASELWPILQLLAKVLQQQAQILAADGDTIKLTAQQRHTLIRHMRDFLTAITILNPARQMSNFLLKAKSHRQGILGQTDQKRDLWQTDTKKGDQDIIVWSRIVKRHKKSRSA
ncbi:MucBP domain-containing protein [Lacticaseibacillus baoqingensis]|uniref:MucBP domain-containing protein n=1 Tax=Lacticaseibacillus baoqingensis TaxID=2486013 RepID=A0ABW4E8B2_9LACO|nr:MucBP domain-containing protein [Lacticaseibacillus baoqingensis]